MKDGEDWQMRDRKLYVNVQRFVVELEHLGYAHVTSNDFSGGDLKSDEIKKLAEEMKLLSSEITESRIQEEMQSSEISDDGSMAKSSRDLDHMKSSVQDLKPNNFTSISPDIIAVKEEMIELLKNTIESKDDDITNLRGVIEKISEQNHVLTRQNAWLTNLLVAPKDAASRVKSNEIDIDEDDHVATEPGERVSPHPDNDANNDTGSADGDRTP